MRQQKLGKEWWKAFWGDEKGRRSSLSQYSSAAFSRHMLTLLLAHEITTSKHQFNEFLPRTMMLRKLQKGQFQKLRNVKRFVNELYPDPLKNAGLASAREEKLC